MHRFLTKSVFYSCNTLVQRVRLSIVFSWLLLIVFASHAQGLDKIALAGWSKPITEITNLLVEPEKGFF